MNFLSLMGFTIIATACFSRDEAIFVRGSGEYVPGSPSR
jgi:hypothetical protein